MENNVKILNITGSSVSKDDRFIPDYEQLISVTDFFKREGKIIGYTSGSYDLFHVGHTRYLHEAKKRCDILIVGLDSDSLIKKDKGDRRPIVPFVERMEILTHNRSVDIVTELISNEQTDELIKKLSPNIMVLSTSTKKDPEKSQKFVDNMKNKLGKFVSEFVILEAQAETSTSARVRNLAVDGGKELFELLQDKYEEYMRNGGVK